jgi:hypothetical protein
VPAAGVGVLGDVVDEDDGGAGAARATRRGKRRMTVVTSSMSLLEAPEDVEGVGDAVDDDEVEGQGRSSP